ncbi:ANTAR domain-containing protein [Rhodococcus sovatensis]|uniref:ANTAR domain-containing protein n=1 Tax=Rhodococcus sovatensis TaxID=1805840 RepID=A0ABZ2PJY4_9NOCA
MQISRRAHSAREEVDGLHTAMKNRADIEQAKGIIMALRGMNADDAFAVLSEQSQNRNIKVSEIAAAIVDSVAQPGHSDCSSQDIKRRSNCRSDE